MAGAPQMQLHPPQAWVQRDRGELAGQGPGSQAELGIRRAEETPLPLVSEAVEVLCKCVSATGLECLCAGGEAD